MILVSMQDAEESFCLQTQSVRQRKDCGLSLGDNFAHVFVTPPDPFDNGWLHSQNFSWRGDEVATTNRKWPKVKVSGASQPVPQLSAGEKEEAWALMLQFLLMLEIEDNKEEEETNKTATTRKQSLSSSSSKENKNNNDNPQHRQTGFRKRMDVVW